MVGKWTYTALYSDQINAANNVAIASQHVSYTVQPGDYYQFNSDGTWSQKSGSSTYNGTYSVNSATTFTIVSGGVNNPCTVVTLTGNTFVFTVTGTPGATYTQFTHSLSR